MTEMKSLLGLFNEPSQVAETIDALFALGIPNENMVVMSGAPYPEGALGRHRTWLTLPYIVAAGAVAGLLFGLFLAVITPHLYRLDIGGHPPVGFAPAAIIIFVFTMMAVIVSTFLGVLWEMDFPRFGLAPYHRLVTQGQLALLLEFHPDLEQDVMGVLEEHYAQQIDEPERMAL